VRSFATTKPPSDDKPKKKRRTKAEMLASKLDAELLAGANILQKEKVPAKKTKKSTKKVESKHEPAPMYTLKFNSPILPYAKFPLT